MLPPTALSEIAESLGDCEGGVQGGSPAVQLHMIPKSPSAAEKPAPRPFSQVGGSLSGHVTRQGTEVLSLQRMPQTSEPANFRAMLCLPVHRLILRIVILSSQDVCLKHFFCFACADSVNSRFDVIAIASMGYAFLMATALSPLHTIATRRTWIGPF
jgi:hypothetical protein